jgi:hypothetical protein
MQIEEFDTTSAFDNVTNMRFTPLVAGYYQVNGAMYPTTATTAAVVAIYKNGSSYKAGASNAGSTALPVSVIVYLNGSTDYIELWGTLTGTTPSTFGASHLTYFQAALISRTA